VASCVRACRRRRSALGGGLGRARRAAGALRQVRGTASLVCPSSVDSSRLGTAAFHIEVKMPPLPSSRLVLGFIFCGSGTEPDEETISSGATRGTTVSLSHPRSYSFAYASSDLRSSLCVQVFVVLGYFVCH
jgi:hypothetical protein